MQRFHPFPVLVLLTLTACGASDPDSGIRVNGVELGGGALAELRQVERGHGFQLPPGDYWYDARCGALGRRGGPALGLLPAGLSLGGGVLAADASGSQTGVFFNGRELHPVDLAQLQAVAGRIAPGRYFLDAAGNAGREGGPVWTNLRQAGVGGGNWNHSTRVGGGNLHVGGDGNGFSYYLDSSGTSWSSGY